MDIAADIVQLPGVAPGETISGGIAAGQWTSAGADSCLLYRYTPHMLEVRSLEIPSLKVPESLATLSTHQLQVNTVEDLEISHVSPVTLNDTQYMLVFARETLSETGRLYTFNAFTLSVHCISAVVPYRPRAIGVSPPVRAGQGSSTEWEFAAVCFGLDKGRVLVGNLTVGADASQLTALSKSSMDAHRCAVTHVCVRERADAPGRVLMWLGLESGHVACLEYEPFSGGRISLVCSVAEGAQLGPVARVAAVELGGSRVALCAGHGDAVSVYTADMVPKPAVTHVATRQVQATPDGGQEPKAAELVDLQFLGAEGDVPIIAALAATAAATAERRDRVRSASRRAPSADTVHGFFAAWAYDEQAAKLVEISRQAMSGPDVILGMYVSGKALQLEVATSRRLLIGDALADSGTDGADASTRDVCEFLDIDGAFAYTSLQRHALAEQRQRMGGELFIDLLLRMTGAKGSAYPPRTPADQRALLAQISASDLDDVKQQCIAYYMVLDSSARGLVSANGGYAESDADPSAGNEMASRYASEVLLPRHFVYLMRGYWLLDHAQVAAGMPYLADPSVVADWAPKILQAAVSAGYYPDAMSFLDSATALTPPRLDEQPTSAPAVMDVLLRCDFSRAFLFQRRHAQELRRALLAQLFSFALSAQSRRATVDQLAMLPFDGAEEAALAAHCLDADVAAPHARDFLALHYVNCGRYAEAIRLFKSIAKREEGEALTGVQRKKRDERLAMVRNLQMLLPEAQRGVADELETMDEGAHVQLARAAGPPEPAARPMDVDGAAEPRAKGPRVQPANVPLSASKAVRQQRSVVGVHGVPQSPLLRVLMRQVTVEKPALDLTATRIEPDVPSTPRAAGGAERGPATPWKTPMSELPAEVQRSGARRVPFSGPPSTPRAGGALGADAETPVRQRSLADAGQTPGRGVLAQASMVETPVAKRVPGGFPEPSPVSRSPFEIARQAAKPTKAETRPSFDTAKPKKTESRASSDTAKPSEPESSPQRYNLRTRTGMTPGKPAAKPRTSRRSKKASDSDASSDQQSAREFERSLRRSGKEPKQSSRTRKRE
ncbi:hypothetical protein IWW50_001531 [Coemansia erecta]|nr:hypothetical protein IWW50_001531 [Coemansia erecta]